jgi:HEAT repeat protein
VSAQRRTIPIRELGQDFSVHDWKDYRSVLPPEELDEAYLLALLSDESFNDEPTESPLPWVPLHAWRALAQLHATSAIEPMVRIASSPDDSHAYGDFTKFSAEIGESAIAPLQAILADRSRPELQRTVAAKGLGGIGCQATGATRAGIVESLMDQIRNNPGDGWINGTAVAALVAMDERTVGPEVLQMYKEGRIQGGGIRGAEITGYFGPLPE